MKKTYALFAACALLAVLSGLAGAQDPKADDKPAPAPAAEDKPAGESLDLSIKFIKGLKTRSRTTTVTDLDISVAEFKQHSITTNVMDGTQTCTDVTEDGGAKVKISTDRVQIKKIENKEEVVKFDSKKDKVGDLDEESAMTALIAGIEFTADVDKQGVVSNVKGMDAYREAVKEELGAESTDAVDSAQVTMVQSLEQPYKMLPKEPVKVGDSWKHDWSLDIAGLGKMTFKGTYKLEGVEDKAGRKCAKIAVTGDISIEAAADAEMAIEVKNVDWKGSMWLDLKTRETVYSEMSMKYDLAMAMMDMEFVMPSKVTVKIELLGEEADKAEDKAAGEGKPAEPKPEPQPEPQPEKEGK
jgi:hypothetical protein